MSFRSEKKCWFVICLSIRDKYVGEALSFPVLITITNAKYFLPYSFRLQYCFFLFCFENTQMYIPDSKQKAVKKCILQCVMGIPCFRKSMPNYGTLLYLVLIVLNFFLKKSLPCYLLQLFSQVLASFHMRLGNILCKMF